MADESYDKAIKFCAPIAKPLASQKLCKKVLKLCKKATKSKQVKRGVKEVVKAIRKNHKGIVVLAGDISPIDVITHVPVLCEDNDIPYIYVPSKEPIKAGDDPDEEVATMYKEVKGKMSKLETA